MTFVTMASYRTAVPWSTIWFDMNTYTEPMYYMLRVVWCQHTEGDTVYPKKYAHGFCFAVLCCGYTLTDFPISIRLTSLALWQSNDCPSASKATLMNMDKYFMWIHYERLHNHNKAKHNKTMCIFLGIYCTCTPIKQLLWFVPNPLQAHGVMSLVVWRQDSWRSGLD